MDFSNFQKINIRATWAAIGKFDAIYICEPLCEYKNIFRQIETFSNIIARESSIEFHYHPIYLIHNGTDEDWAHEQSFWENPMWYLSIVRIHLASSISSYSEIQFIESEIKKEFSISGCKLICYRTMELSDLVLAVQSDNLSSQLNIILHLRKYKLIGRIYTHSGVNYDKLRDVSEPPPFEDLMQLYSMRFSVHIPRLTDEAIKQIESKLGKGTVFSITGVDDMLIIWSNLPTGRLVDLYRSWFCEKADLNCFKAFSQFTTRLGVEPSMSDFADAEDAHLTKLVKKCEDLIALNQRILPLFSHGSNQQFLDPQDSDFGWKYLLFELSVSLGRLSNTSVLDEFAYLMLPGADAFLRNMESELNNNNKNKFSNLRMNDCRQFIDSWTQLLEQITRIEGQLSQQPELRPVLYNIPLAFLEYLMVFLGKCVNFLQYADDLKDRRKICFMLIPGLFEQVQAKELFMSRKDGTPGLVLISIPLHMLYRPGELQLILCHEVSHFAGEAFRKRKDRIKFYAKATAHLLDDKIFKTSNRACIEYFYNKIYAILNGAQNIFRIQEYQEAVQGWVSSIATLRAYHANHNEYSNFIREMLTYAYRNDCSDTIPVEADYIHLERKYMCAFLPALDYLSSSFREIFADLCMLKILQIEPKFYIQSFLPELDPSCPAHFEFAALRVYICLKAIGQNVPEKKKVASGEPVDIFYSTLYQMEQESHCHPDSLFGKGGNKTKFCIPPGARHALLDYAKMCAETIQSEIEKNEGLRELAISIRSAFCNIKGKWVNTDNLMDMIWDYRKNYIELHCKSENSK